MAQPLRIVVWSTGWVGSLAIRSVHRRPELDLVGVWVHDPDKDGRDVGELVGLGPSGWRPRATPASWSGWAHRAGGHGRRRRAGRAGPIGLAATGDADALVVVRPDCVVDAASGPQFDAVAVPDPCACWRRGSTSSW